MNSRLGFHYFPDTLHYRDADLQTWLPQLEALGAKWLVIRSELDRAIPEAFLQGLQKAGIEPVIQFGFSLERQLDLNSLSTLLEVYARWGAHYLIFFDRPNARSAWPTSSWVQQELVERFLDRFLPPANLALKAGLVPLFPPLEPAGNYWDTAFLRSALQALQRRKQDNLLQNLILSAYAWSGSYPAEVHSLDWGAGGPERWPLARPYLASPGSQDQRGFRIFDWYQAIARSVLQQPVPVMLLQAGLPGDPRGLISQGPLPMQAESYLSIARLLSGDTVVDPMNAENVLEPVPAEVIACSFWLLSADPADPFAGQAWFQGEEEKQPAVDLLRAWKRDQAEKQRRGEGQKLAGGQPALIRHYLLLPGLEWGVSDWYLEVIRPFVKKYRPTVGFAPEEAERAARVTVVGNSRHFPDNLISRLESAGCWVEQIDGDGTNIASELAER